MFDTTNMIEALVQGDVCRYELLYHYCTADSAAYLFNHGADIGARSLLKSPNDKKEYYTGIEMFCDYLADKRIMPNEIVAILSKNLHSNIDDGGKGRECVIPFAFCLSHEFNSPYHWSEFVKEGGGYCVAFSKEKLAAACQCIVQKRTASLDLARCLYVGYDDEAIAALFDAVCQDRSLDLATLVRTRTQDACAGERIMQQVCMVAMRIKRAKYYPEKEWRITMVSRNSEAASEKGYLATGIKNVCCHNDIMSMMRGVLSSPTRNQLDLQAKLFRMIDTRNRHKGEIAVV